MSFGVLVAVAVAGCVPTISCGVSLSSLLSFCFWGELCAGALGSGSWVLGSGLWLAFRRAFVSFLFSFVR